MKTAKDGPGSIEDLADEVEDLVHTALGLQLHFRAESAFTATVDRLQALSLDGASLTIVNSEQLGDPSTG